jgi:hypothetical protein
MSVAEAQEKIDSHELTRWRAYERIRGPIGPMRDYIVAAMISANIINALGGKVSAADLIPDFDISEPEPDRVDIHAEAEAARLRLNMLRMMKNQQEKR